MQAFEGIVLAQKHGTEPGATFTVRAIIDGVSVEKIFPLYSPFIDKIEILKHSKVRRSKLYYIRNKFAKAIRQKLRRSMVSSKATLSDEAEKKRIEAAAKEAEEKKLAEEQKRAEEEKQKAEAAASADKVENNEAVAEEVSQATPQATEPETPKEPIETPEETSQDTKTEASAETATSDTEEKKTE